MIYLLWYIDGKEYTGERRWDACRKWRLWRFISPITYHIENKTQLCAQDRRRIYFIWPCDTLISLIWTIGFHGGRLDFAEHLHYVVPPLFMAIPILRDILLWSGAVTWKTSVDDLVLNLLQNGKSVCIAPSMFAGVTWESFILEAVVQIDDIERGPKYSTKRISDVLLQFCLHEKLQLVPIVIRNERKRYWFPLHTPWLQSIQRLTMRFWHYPVPFVFLLRVWAREKPPPLSVQFGSILVCTQSSKEQLWEVVQEMIASLSCVALGDAEFVFQP